jgi:sec-independent protein translocase protein TatA
MGLDNPIHLLVLLMILLLVFGAKRLPEMGRSLGAGLRGFKESIGGDATPAHIDQMTADAAGATAPTDTGATAPADTASTEHAA